MSYLPIESHGVIGDLHTCALVGIDGAIDWMCLPHFDSPSVFGSILDDEKGGAFRISAVSKEVHLKQMYLPDTNVLTTRFLTPDGVGEVVDFMAIQSGELGRHHDSHRLVRLIRGVRGTIPFELEFDAAPDYARESPKIEKGPLGFAISGSSIRMNLMADLPLRRRGRKIVAEFDLRHGQEIPVVLAHGESVGDVSAAALLRRSKRDFDVTVQYWRNWIARCQYTGHWREMVKRSCLALKLLTFIPTGAIVAAPTTSLPERIGGSRNWDYRFTWVRDAAFTLYALIRVGFREEAEAFVGFLQKRLAEREPNEGLKVLYAIDGRRDVSETSLDHLAGYRGSAPVRIGNAAVRQLQLDITGELVDSLYLYNKYVRPMSHDLWASVRSLADWVAEHWTEADDGIWEVRDGRQQFTFSKLMCWVALDRTYRLSINRSFPGNRHRWLDHRDQIYETIMERGFSKKLQAFVQVLDSDELDASMLLTPMVRFVSPSDPRMLSTLKAIQRELVSDSLVHRYDPRLTPDGVGGKEGTFSMCTFWLAEALARSGQLDEARLIFDRMLGYSNHLGLYSEEIGLTGESLGNFPQAFTHLGLISAAYNTSLALDGKLGGVPSPTND